MFEQDKDSQNQEETSKFCKAQPISELEKVLNSFLKLFKNKFESRN